MTDKISSFSERYLEKRFLDCFHITHIHVLGGVDVPFGGYFADISNPIWRTARYFVLISLLISKSLTLNDKLESVYVDLEYAN